MDTVGEMKTRTETDATMNTACKTETDATMNTACKTETDFTVFVFFSSPPSELLRHGTARLLTASAKQASAQTSEQRNNQKHNQASSSKPTAKQARIQT